MTGPATRRRPAARRGAGACRAGQLLFWLFAWALPAAGAPAPASVDPETAGVLNGVVWRAGALGEKAEGVGCWLRGERGELRVEVARLRSGAEAELDGPGWDRLLARRGEGWTYADAGAGAVLFAQWGDRLRTPEASLAPRLELLLRLREAGPGFEAPTVSPQARLLSSGRQRPPARRFGASTGSPSPAPEAGVVRIVLADPVPGDRPSRGTSFRTAQERRGRGRGAGAEVWTVRWRRDPSRGNALRIESSRLEGFVEVGPPQLRAVRYRAEEAFLPLWGLDELVAPGAGAPVDTTGANP